MDNRKFLRKGTAVPVTPFASKQRRSNGNGEYSSLGKEEAVYLPLPDLLYGVTVALSDLFFARVRRFLTESRLEFNYGTAAGFSGE